MGHSIQDLILNFVIILFLLIVVIIFPLNLWQYEMYEGVFIYAIGIAAGIILLLTIYIFKQRLRRLQISEISPIMLRLLNILTVIFILAFLTSRNINIETFSQGEKESLAILFFFLTFLIYNEIFMFKRLFSLIRMGITGKWLKSIAKNTNSPFIKERLFLIDSATESYIWEKYLVGIIIISNFIEEIIDKLYYEKNKEHTGFKKKVKSLQLDNIKDPISNYTLMDFYYKIRSKYAHELYKKGISPSEEEMKISLRLMKEFVKVITKYFDQTIDI